MSAIVVESAPRTLSELLSAAFATERSAIDAPPPCFHWTACGQAAALEKSGRSVCRRCAAALRGVEYPLRKPSRESLYESDHLAAEALDMLEVPPDEAASPLGQAADGDAEDA